MTGSRPNLNIARFAACYRVPVRFLNEVIRELVNGGILGELSESPGSYVLLRAPDFVKVTDVLDVTLRHGVDSDALGLNRVDALARTIIREATETMYDSVKDVSIRQLMSRGEDSVT